MFPSDPFSLGDNIPLINETFSADSIEEILERLRSKASCGVTLDERDWAKSLVSYNLCFSTPSNNYSCTIYLELLFFNDVTNIRD